MNLKRSLNLPLLTLYGLGNILGAGIYVLIGKVSALADIFTPVAFLVASILVATTAFTFSELSSRYPKSAGPALYLYKAFGLKQLSVVVGLLIMSTGVLSAATITTGFVGYFNVFFNFPDPVVIIPLLLILTLLAIWGIKQSASIAAAITLIEIAGLLIIIWVGQNHIFNFEFIPYIKELTHAPSALWIGIFSGAFLAFYAFIGFEDMVHVAEEVIEPEKNMPRAILLSLAISTLIYFLVALVSISALPIQDLGNSKAPLALIFKETTGLSPDIVAVIGMLAIINGALIQIIMASRVVFGMSTQGWIPKALGNINAKTQTPIQATVAVAIVILILTLWLPIVTLAELTSLFILVIFSLMHLSLIRIKTAKQNTNLNVKQYHIAIPIIGLITNVGFVGFYLIY